MELIGNIGKRYVNDKQDVRSELVKALRVGASIQEACAFVGVPLDVYHNWEYTYNELDKIISYMYSHKIEEYIDIDTDSIQEEDINIYLVNKLKKNKYYGSDVYTLIKQCNKAIAEVTIYHLQNIYSPKKKKDTDWKASAWFLERVNPDRYGKNPTNEETATVSKIEVEFVNPDKTETKDRLKDLEQEVRESLNIIDGNQS